MCKSRIDINYSLGCLGLENDLFFKFDLYTPQQWILNHQKWDRSANFQLYFLDVWQKYYIGCFWILYIFGPFQNSSKNLM